MTRTRWCWLAGALVGAAAAVWTVAALAALGLAADPAENLDFGDDT